MGKYNRIGWAWFGATLGGYIGDKLALHIINGTIAPLGSFIFGAYLGVLLGEAISTVSVASGVRGMVIGTKHAIAASTGGYFGLIISQSVPMANFTSFPDLTISAIGGLIGVIVFEIQIY